MAAIRLDILGQLLQDQLAFVAADIVEARRRRPADIADAQHALGFGRHRRTIAMPWASSRREQIDQRAGGRDHDLPGARSASPAGPIEHPRAVARRRLPVQLDQRRPRPAATVDGGPAADQHRRRRHGSRPFPRFRASARAPRRCRRQCRPPDRRDIRSSPAHHAPSRRPSPSTPFAPGRRDGASCEQLNRFRVRIGPNSMQLSVFIFKAIWPHCREDSEARARFLAHRTGRVSARIKNIVAAASRRCRETWSISDEDDVMAADFADRLYLALVSPAT